MFSTFASIELQFVHERAADRSDGRIILSDIAEKEYRAHFVPLSGEGDSLTCANQYIIISATETVAYRGLLWSKNFLLQG